MALSEEDKTWIAAILDQRIGGVESRLTKLTEQGDALDAKIDAVEARLTKRIDALDAKIDAVEARLTSGSTP